ncbi:hypothetical protein NDU88_001039, partial [Pleurodeles waltl]
SNTTSAGSSPEKEGYNFHPADSKPFCLCDLQLAFLQSLAKWLRDHLWCERSLELS